jgi:uncharacterized protein (DUF433 family)
MIEPGKRSGQPCVRGLRITVWDVLAWLAGGMTDQQIPDDYPELEPDDFRAVYEFAARMGRRVEHRHSLPVPSSRSSSLTAIDAGAKLQVTDQPRFCYG